MADSKVSDLAALTGADSASTDLAVVVDVSDATMAASGTTKKMTLAEFATGLIAHGSLATVGEVTTAVSDHSSDTTSVHGITDTADILLKSTYNAHTVLYATTNDTPVSLTVSEETVVGRVTGGNIAAVNPSAIAQTVVTVTSSTTLALSDAGKIVELNSGSALTLTIPANAGVAFPVGTRVDVVQYGAGAVTVTGSVGVTVRRTAALTLVTNGQYSGCTLYKRATDEWVAIGDLVPA